VKKGVDASKDQSYFLARLPQRLLARILFPVGSLTKESARKMAKSVGLPVSEKEESQEVCFVKEGEQESFLEERIGKRSGEILDELGHVLGEHTGVYRFTIGQRRGLGISKGAPLYVTSIDAGANRVFVGPEESLLRRTVLLEDVKLLAPSSGIRVSVTAKVRYAAPLAPASFEHTGETKAKVTFEGPQRAVAPGQLLVAYTGDTAYASGWIASSR
jgi:tRNA-specific 2-thiouridylase